MFLVATRCQADEEVAAPSAFGVLAGRAALCGTGWTAGHVVLVVAGGSVGGGFGWCSLGLV